MSWKLQAHYKQASNKALEFWLLVENQTQLNLTLMYKIMIFITRKGAFQDKIGVMSLILKKQMIWYFKIGKDRGINLKFKTNNSKLSNWTKLIGILIQINNIWPFKT